MAAGSCHCGRWEDRKSGLLSAKGCLINLVMVVFDLFLT